jgi:glycosyltransferase involved in cell wall biosynthesis
MVADDFVPAATGVGTYLQRVTRELSARRHEVTVITSRRAGEPPIETWNSVTIHRTATVRAYGYYQAIPSVAAVRGILQQVRPDVIHCHYLGLLLMRTLGAARGMTSKTVYTYHMTIDHLTQPMLLKPLRPLLHRLHIRYCNRFDLLLAPSQNLISRIRGYGITAPARFVTNPVAFDLPAMACNAAPATAPFTVLYVGRLSPEKNLPYLLEAFARFTSRVSIASRLLIAGEGDMRQHLEDLCVRLRIHDRTRFLGFVAHPDLAGYYSTADVFVLPSLVEAQPMVVIEAMCFGKPVIVTRQMISANELVVDGENGFLVDANDVEELTSRLQMLATDAERRALMARNALQRSHQYALDTVVDRLETIYGELVNATDLC